MIDKIRIWLNKHPYVEWVVILSQVCIVEILIVFVFNLFGVDILKLIVDITKRVL